MKVAWALAFGLAAACGRVSFDPLTSDARDDGDVGDVGDVDGAPMPMIACADMNLGSALGPSVAAGVLTGAGNDWSSCGASGPDISFGWFAPATASYVIDTCASDVTFDSVLHVYDGSCSGSQLGCSDNVCGLSGLQSRVTVSLTAGQGIVIVLDAPFIGVVGNYQLAITQL